MCYLLKSVGININTVPVLDKLYKLCVGPSIITRPTWIVLMYPPDPTHSGHWYNGSGSDTGSNIEIARFSWKFCVGSCVITRPTCTSVHCGLGLIIIIFFLAAIQIAWVPTILCRVKTIVQGTQDVCVERKYPPKTNSVIP